MQRLLIITLTLVLSIASEAQTDEVTSTINNWHKAAEEADFKTYFDLMTTDAVFVGSDASEVWNYKAFKAFSKPYFETGKAWTFVPVNRNIYVNDKKDMAWFDEVLNSDHMGLCRGSGVLIKEKGKWKIQHYVLSLAVPNALVDELVSEKSKLDKEYLESHP